MTAKNLFLFNSFRWLLVLPTSVCSFIIATLIWEFLHYIQTIQTYASGNLLNSIYAESMYMIIGTVSFILSGSSVAPKHQEYTGLFLGVLLITIYGALLFFVNYIIQNYVSNISTIAGIITAGIVIYQLSLKKNKS